MQPKPAVFTALAVLCVGTPAHSLDLLTNLPPVNDVANNSIQSNIQKALGFDLLGSTDYVLEAIDLRLQFYSTPGDVALVQIYADPSRTSLNPNPADLQSVLFINPESLSDNAGTFTFTPIHF